ncbi:MAG TPA: autorepressor SdpR family transcription factor [Treponemataceae bacterium]|nr:autorepressor SdpR family transcription factor [Treponemataceae bacterium]
MNDLFKALSDKTRRDILELLKTRDMSAGEIASAFPISAASISHHLNILKQADLVASVRDGQNIIYSLNTSVFQDLVSWVYTLQGKD